LSLAIASQLTPIRVRLDDILLDPNNPRFADLGEDEVKVPEAKFADAKVQAKTTLNMRNERFNVLELRDTVKSIGFLPMDRIVVRHWLPNPKKFVLIEGNRRVTALKWLIELEEEGKWFPTPEQLANITSLEVLLLDDNATQEVAWILPGLRHVSGIKEWGPFQKARAVIQLRDAGIDPVEAAQSLGLSTRKANSLWRSYLALQQMKEDDDFGDFVKANHYSYFEELFKKRRLWEEWLEWSDDEKKFTNNAGIHEFYSWMIGESDESDEDGETTTARLPEAKSVRQLDKIFADERAMAAFRGSGGDLESASAQLAVEKAQDWRPAVNTAESTLSTLSADTIRGLTADDLAALDRLAKRLARVVKDQKSLAASA